MASCRDHSKLLGRFDPEYPGRPASHRARWAPRDLRTRSGADLGASHFAGGPTLPGRGAQHTISSAERRRPPTGQSQSARQTCMISFPPSRLRAVGAWTTSLDSGTRGPCFLLSGRGVPRWEWRHRRERPGRPGITTKRQRVPFFVPTSPTIAPGDGLVAEHRLQSGETRPDPSGR